ncbi:MAG: Flagellar P-ring protein FlgI [Phycisphaerales bacterium]|nr:Flagellar P-ring protein FlgI [Phycisphaerales bacterium]
MRTRFPLLAAALILLAAAPARAVQIADITRPDGQRTNVLTGVGLVYGLKGTGDGGDFMPAIKPLAAMLGQFANPTPIADLKNAANVAVVSLIATVPSTGVRNGDHIDVRVVSLGAASSLRGGYLFVSPMQGPMPADRSRGPQMPLALSEGLVVIDDPATPTAGVITGGCVMEANLLTRAVDDAGRFTLVIADATASWAAASTIAKVINDAEGEDGAVLAVAIDPKNVVVTVPPADRARPDSFVARVQRLPVPQLSAEARVSVNEKTGTIIVTGDVEVDPTVISHRGMTITVVDPKPTPTPRTPVVTRQNVVALDPAGTGGAKLQDLTLALDQLKVSADDRISIVKQLHEMGKLHAKLIVNGVERH